MDCPALLYYDIESQVWAEPLADGSVRVGVTALGVKLSGEFFMCRPKPVGHLLERGRSLAVAELAKSIVSIPSPLSGRVLETNPLLSHEPDWFEDEISGLPCPNSAHQSGESLGTMTSVKKSLTAGIQALRRPRHLTRKDTP
ncbi:MAG: hypothetical protein C4K60_21160 [Ideonella sp. MAG2]|nr:MAG: hypothetical protein C4K60_21160 [Ideonella sp. MAG2]